MQTFEKSDKLAIDDATVEEVLATEFPELQFRCVQVNEVSMMKRGELTRAIEYVKRRNVFEYAKRHVPGTDPNEPPTNSITYPIPNPQRKTNFRVDFLQTLKIYDGTLSMYNDGHEEVQVQFRGLHMPARYEPKRSLYNSLKIGKNPINSIK
jgi:hypothetical protein